jgi:hypothetical protein
LTEITAIDFILKMANQPKAAFEMAKQLSQS